MNTDLIKNEDGTYTLTLEQLQGLSAGDIRFIDGVLYLNGDKVPKPIGWESLGVALTFKESLKDLMTSHHVTEEDLIILTEKESEMVAKGELTISEGKLISKSDISFDKEIKEVNLKGTYLAPENRDIVNSLIIQIKTDPQDHPFNWVKSAEMLSELGGTDKVKVSLLEILNNVIHLKPGMKLEGFSAKEFDEKYLYTQPSLLEQAVSELSLDPVAHPKVDSFLSHQDTENKLSIYVASKFQGVSNKEVKDLERILIERYNDHINKELGTFKEFVEHAILLHDEYRNLVIKDLPLFESIQRKGIVDGCSHEERNFYHGLYLQEQYWPSFRGRAITIIKLFNNIFHPNNLHLHL